MKGLYIKLVLSILCTGVCLQVHASDTKFYIPMKEKIATSYKASLCVPMEEKNLILDREVKAASVSASTHPTEPSHKVSYVGGMYTTGEQRLQSYGMQNNAGFVAYAAASAGKTSDVGQTQVGVGSVSLSFVRYRDVKPLCTLADEEMERVMRRGYGSREEITQDGGTQAGVLIPVGDGLVFLLVAAVGFGMIHWRRRESF